ncbi:MAG TPA: metallophosphoesterase [Alphaproteobacteria bacterium]|jgi:3',5'-cyclic AMP phosphodiesterase CpdA|nr:metallophosphoesterase [Alphaproteobacteria bacterium]
MTVIAHISDLHFGAEDPVVVAGLLAELRQNPVDLVAISGDITQHAFRREYRAAGAFINALPAPVLAVPGNHDLPQFNLAERFISPYARWHADIAPDPEPIWRDDKVAVVGINTVHRARIHWDWSRGKMNTRRLGAVRDRLEDLPENLVRIVVAHHPMMASEERPRMALLGNARRTLRMLSALDVRLVLSGHAHRSYSRIGLGGGPLIVQCATTTSVRLRGEPNAYNRISVGGSGDIAVQVRVWDGDGWTVQGNAESD